ncbi:16S rRNA (uracil(1498)-N(3))-methyltransferase [Romeria aff. gracilis LEGE 07310]|uniref:Ribosomal RNA small subunit methyltransferase E n=1 Tax=Vasconcelosia minhoensis LEGE 07310 TaxID=915328 RepID=A0A8J7ACI9_9CYAN|nr:16S rRNA (uracil(1498)-N(3))-methyltransferase [Romeria gracilis]MBE9077681.1 16S rRNA (uracil(1498)-N(3))-methyltransferase [Romeria aff. gracilis LEGE 07310]
MSQLQRLTISEQQCQGRTLDLLPEQVHYLRRVLRLAPGSRFIAQDGQGQQWLATLGDKLDQAELEEVQRGGSAIAPFILIAALPKGSGFDAVVRQATEIGVTDIYPVLSQRTLLNPSDSRVSRWQRIAQEASEQSERLTIPEIHPPVSFPALLQQPALASQQYLCVARGEYPHLLTQLQKDLSAAAAVAIAIGPEGGWTPEEIAEAAVKGYQPVSLGSAILRAVTASIVALAIVAAVREPYR